MNNKKFDVVILGAGLAGLAAGFELSKKNIKVLVIEKWEDVGGLARTIKVRNFLFDTGPHRWYTKNDSVNKWMLDLLGDEVIKVPRLTRIYFDQKYFYYPIKFKNAIFGIGPVKSFMAIVDYFIARFKARLFRPRLLTMEDGYVNQFGKTLFDIFFKRYSEKLWGQDCKAISVDWVGQRTRGLSIMTLIKDALFKTKNVVSLVDEFSYPKRGVGRIADKLKEGITERGGQIILNSEVTKIDISQNKVESIEYKKDNKKYTVSGNNFISSIPLNDLINRLNPPASPKVISAAQKLEYRDELQVVLFIQKSHITPDTWVYVHPKNISFMRFMEMDNWSKELSPLGKTSIVFEIACNEGDEMWSKKDSELIKIVGDEFINEFKLVKDEDMMGGYVHRVPKEYPVYHLDYKKDVEIIKNYLKRFANLQIIGRNGTFRYNNMDHSIEMGLYAAWNIISGTHKYNIDSVNIEREYLEEKKIENIEDEKVEEE